MFLSLQLHPQPPLSLLNGPPFSNPPPLILRCWFAGRVHQNLDMNLPSATTRLKANSCIDSNTFKSFPSPSKTPLHPAGWPWNKQVAREEVGLRGVPHIEGKSAAHGTPRSIVAQRSLLKCRTSGRVGPRERGRIHASSGGRDCHCGPDGPNYSTRTEQIRRSGT